MRDIASLYGDPTSSLMSLSRDTMSRDPDGLDPSDDYYSSQLEPDGVLSGEQSDIIQEEPPEDEEYHGQQEPPDYRDDATPTNSVKGQLDLATLVGIPPPPPTAPPPKKKGKRGKLTRWFSLSRKKVTADFCGDFKIFKFEGGLTRILQRARRSKKEPS